MAATHQKMLLANAVPDQDVRGAAAEDLSPFPENDSPLTPTASPSPSLTPIGSDENSSTTSGATGQTLDICTGNEDLAMCQVSRLGVGEALGTVVQFLFVIAVILALGFLVYGGIRWITSGGDKGGVETARGTIIAAIIGLILVFLAYVILNLVLQFLTGSTIEDLKIPSLVGSS